MQASERIYAALKTSNLNVMHAPGVQPSQQRKHHALCGGSTSGDHPPQGKRTSSQQPSWRALGLLGSLPQLLFSTNT